MKKALKRIGGKFAPGNAGGPGRPARQTEREYLAATVAGCTLDDWQAIVKVAVIAAKTGDRYAREWLSGFFLGEPATESITLRKLAFDEAVGRDSFGAAVKKAREELRDAKRFLKSLPKWDTDAAGNLIDADGRRVDAEGFIIEDDPADPGSQGTDTDAAGNPL